MAKFQRFEPPVALFGRFGRGQLKIDLKIEISDTKNPKLEKFIANTKFYRFQPPVALFGLGQLKTDFRIELNDTKNPRTDELKGNASETVRFQSSLPLDDRDDDDDDNIRSCNYD